MFPSEADFPLPYNYSCISLEVQVAALTGSTLIQDSLFSGAAGATDSNVAIPASVDVVVAPVTDSTAATTASSRSSCREDLVSQ